jgi:glycosyltransferase involved in cell wall biosynthesis
MNQMVRPARIAFLLDNLTGGGAEKVILNLASGFEKQGHPVDILVCKMEGVLCNSIPAGVNLVPLKASTPNLGFLCAMRADPLGFRAIAGMFTKRRPFRFIPPIAAHLKASKPTVLVSALPKSNINAVLGKYFSGTPTRVVVGAHINMSTQDAECYSSGKNKLRYMRPLLRRCYRRADAVVAVSKGVAKDITEYLGLDRDHVTAIYNPIETRRIEALSRESSDHPWFDSADVPLILGVGRFVAQKDFPLLLRAFAKIRENRPARLVLLGGDEASAEQREQKQELSRLAVQLGVQGDFNMLGFKVNPYPFLRRASVFVLSSRYEGFGNVLVEALLCGCPVVSTNCPSGPAEILDNGKYGALVPVGDERTLADAICETLDTPQNKAGLRARGEEFSIDKAVERYRKVLLGSHS